MRWGRYPPTLHIMSHRGRPRPPRTQPNSDDLNGGANPYRGRNHPPAGRTDSPTDQILRLRLESQGLLSRALEMENSMLLGEIRHLRERARSNASPGAGRPQDQPPDLGRSPQPQSLAERIDWVRNQPPPHAVVDHRSGMVTFRTDATRPPTVDVRPVGIHPRFLPLGDHFQEGGTGSPLFSRPQDWSNAIDENPSVRPRRVRRWGTHSVNLDDLHIYVQLGQYIYGGNRPPGRRDPIDPQRPWRMIEAAFFRATVALILQPRTFTDIYKRLTPDQRTPYQQPFLAPVGDPNRLDPRDIVQHLVRSGIIEHWFRLDTVIGFAKSYLRDWARHQAQITATTELGQLFMAEYPSGITHQNDCDFVEDAANEEDTWEENETVEVSMDEEDEIPPLEQQTPSSPAGTPRTMTPEDERVNYGDDN